jgi:Rad3-related DNA helicase
MMAWSLIDKKGEKLKPLVFSNGKTQEDIVNEVLKAINEGNKIIFLKGMCGSGKSAVALNIAKEFNRTSIVVPVKYLQAQYEKDYSENMHIVKDDGEKLGIKILTGRNNFKCAYNKSCNADDRFLPCTIELRKENWDLIKSYLKNNEFVNVTDFGTVDDVRRVSVAASCPHWSPVIGKDWFGTDYGLKDAKSHKYKGLMDKDYIYFEREKGCKYYEQFMSYINSDVMIFNSKKYDIENLLDRKPETDIEIIDECDEFLDSLNNEKRINLNYMKKKVGEVFVKSEDEVREACGKIIEAIDGILKLKWISEIIENSEILKIKDTKIMNLLNLFLNNEFLFEYEELESYYGIAKNFQGLYDDTYVSFSKSKREDLVVNIVNINLEKKLNGILGKNKVFIMMSGTLHSEKVLKDIFGIKDFVFIEAETQHRGVINKAITGAEKNYRWKYFDEGKVTRKDYLESFQKCVDCAEKPFLVHVNSFMDLPSEAEKDKYGIRLMSREKIEELQERYKKGELLQMFKDGKLEVLYSTKCNRGVDLPGNMCKSIVFSKYPFPGMKNVFWRILRKENPEGFREFYFDKAKREFLQRIYRGLRSDDDKINLLSPDSMVMRRGLD